MLGCGDVRPPSLHRALQPGDPEQPEQPDKPEELEEHGVVTGWNNRAAKIVAFSGLWGVAGL